MTHVLVPKHEKLNDKQVKELFAKHNITFGSLPKISIKDAGLKGLEASEGDVIKITRNSLTAGESIFYRGVINE